MSIRRDWFKNKVDILAQAAGTALGLKGKGAAQEAAVKLEEAFRSAFGMDATLALALPLKECLAMLCRGVEPSQVLLIALATYFADWAELLDASGRKDEAALAREKASQCRGGLR